MQPEKPVVTHDRLVAGFGELGLAPGTLVMVHSSLSAFGHVEGGAEAVIAALLAAIAPDGTLVLPTLCQRDKERREETWDIARSPSDVGKITEVFRTWPGAIRSDHFTHSVAALGPLAEEITSGHATAYGRPGPWGERAFGHGSPWERLVEHNALYCFLGVSFRVHTLRHFIQSLVLEDTIARLHSPASEELRAQAAGWNKPGLFPWWNGEQEEEALAALGLIRYVEIGAAMCRSIPARTDVDTLLQLIREQPEQWLNPEFLPWYRRAMAAQD
jgi:aminoglycoside N3'-acetyltransferase